MTKKDGTDTEDEGDGDPLVADDVVVVGLVVVRTFAQDRCGIRDGITRDIVP